MKKLNFDAFAKGKLTGDEIGKLMIKDCITGIISGLNDRDIAEGRKPQTHIMEISEQNKLIDGLSGVYNIKIYREYRDLWKYLTDISIMQMTFAFTIEIALWKIAFTIQSRDRIPIDSEGINFIKNAVNDLRDNINQFFFYEAVKKLIAEYTQIYEILQTMTAFPDDLFHYVNLLIDSYNLLKGKDILPMIEKVIVTEEKIQEALKEIKEVSTLYNETALKALLMPVAKETCIVGGKEDEEY